MIELNCKVIKKVATPHFYINPPPFQVYPPFLGKNVYPPQVTQFSEGPTPPPLIGRGRGGGRGDPTMESQCKLRQLRQHDQNFPMEGKANVEQIVLEEINKSKSTGL